MDQGVIATLGVTGLGALVWLIRLEGRVNTAIALQEKLTDDVEYIRDRIDTALNGKR